MSESISTRRVLGAYAYQVGMPNDDMIARLADVNDGISLVNICQPDRAARTESKGVESRLEGIEARLETVEVRSSSVERRMAALEKRMSSLETTIEVFARKADRRELEVLAIFPELRRMVGGLGDPKTDLGGSPPKSVAIVTGAVRPRLLRLSGRSRTAAPLQHQSWTATRQAYAAALPSREPR